MIYSTTVRTPFVQASKPALLGREIAAGGQPKQETVGPLQASVSASELEAALQARDYMTQTLEGDAANRKAQAQMRLEEAKQRLALLKRWGFNPQVLARAAAQLAREVGAAAEDFAAAVTASQAVDMPIDAPETDDAFLPQGYRDVMERAVRPASISQEDKSTIEAFQSLLREIKQVLEQAARDLRREKSAVAGNDPLAAIEDALSVLENTKTGRTPRVGPFSILI